MAKKRGSAAARARAARQVKKDEIYTPEETTSEPVSPEEPSDDPQVVHHKKFGEIRVQQEDIAPPPLPLVENIRVPVIVNGCLPQPPHTLPPLPAPLPPALPIYNVDTDIPPDGSVIIKAGSFSSETIATVSCAPQYIPHIVNSNDFTNVLKGIEELRTSILKSQSKVPGLDMTVTTMETESPTSIPLPLATLGPSIPNDTLLPEIKEEASCSPVTENSPIETDDTGESLDVVAKKEVSVHVEESEDLMAPVQLEVSTIRRSNRIRTIGILKQKERTQSTSPDPEKPVKVKSRWRRSSELEMHSLPRSERESRNLPLLPTSPQEPESQDQLQERLARELRETAEGLQLFVPITDNEYKTERNACKEAKRMTCDCVLTKEEIDKGEIGCGDDCLNRMLFLECGDRCALGKQCSNKCFMNHAYSECNIFKTEKKGFGLKAMKPIPSNTFIMEYVGEVVDQSEFARRVKSYAKGEVKHFYFMALKGDTVIDATSRGNISRFINHSCDPNAETQKWTVNGELRIGFFSKRPIRAFEEITFDYRFQRYGKEAQKCYCEAPNCRGWIGENADDESEGSDEESEDEEDEEGGDEEDASDEVTQEEVTNEVEKEVKEDSDMELESPDEQPEEEPKPVKVKRTRVRKPRTPAEKKEGRGRGRGRRSKEEPLVEDIGLEEEIQRLTITGVKNRSHTLMLSRLMVRAEDWATRRRLLQLIRSGDEPCKRLFLDYHGLRFLHAWMQTTTTMSDIAERSQARIEILKTLESLPIPNKTMLMDSKVLIMVEEWSGSKPTTTTNSDSQSPNGDSTESDEAKFSSQLEEGEVLMKNLETSCVIKPTAIAAEGTESSVLVDPNSEAHSLMTKLLQTWSTLKEVFKIPKKERMEQMKEHEREADRGYRQSVMSRENLETFYSRYKLEKPRERERSTRDGERVRGQDSPSGSDPDWFRHHRDRKMTKQERREIFALKVLREEETARQRMQQEELWSQHKARCTALGLDPNQHPAMDPISGCPIFFDRNSRTWSQTPVTYPNFQYGHPHAQGYQQAGYPSMIPPAPPPPPNALPYPMITYMSVGSCANPYPTPSPSIHMTPVYAGLAGAVPRYSTPSNVISLTPDPPLPTAEPVVPLEAAAVQRAPESPDAPVLNAVPVNNPMKLPQRWKAAKDPRGFVYYYHIKERRSQWEPPSWTEEQAMAEAQRVLATEEDDSSSESSQTDSEEEEDEEEEDIEEEVMGNAGANLETEIDEENSTLEKCELADTTQPEEDSGGEQPSDALSVEEEADEHVDAEAEKAGDAETGEAETAEAGGLSTPSPTEQPSQSDAMDAGEEQDGSPTTQPAPPATSPVPRPSAKPTKRRQGLVQEHIISPNYESSKSDFKKYKETKLKLKRRKEEKRAAEKIKLKANKLNLKSASKKKKRERRVTSAAAESSTDKKIKENFKLRIAGAIVNSLSPYRRTECKTGKITSNDDFKHLARKLTHFVMLKELKHCQSVDDLQCNDSVKVKARDFVRKYMAKFGPEYERQID